MTSRRKSLGRGLDALLGNRAVAGLETSATPESEGGELRNLPLEWLRSGKYQPRSDMAAAALEELAESIRQQGVLQPVSVRPLGPESYEIIAGERRWRAAQIAGLTTIPALVRPVSDQAAIAMALIENIQREDLNAMEEARALVRLQNEFDLTQHEVSVAVGKPRATIANLMRLVRLEPEVSTLLERGDLEMGHARALLTLAGPLQIEVARLVCRSGLTVRQTEALVQRKQKMLNQPLAAKREATSPDLRGLEDDLANRLGAAVQIRHGASGKGRLIVRYNSLDELEGILTHLR